MNRFQIRQLREGHQNHELMVPGCPLFKISTHRQYPNIVSTGTQKGWQPGKTLRKGITFLGTKSAHPRIKRRAGKNFLRLKPFTAGTCEICIRSSRQRRRRAILRKAQGFTHLCGTDLEPRKKKILPEKLMQRCKKKRKQKGKKSHAITA